MRAARQPASWRVQRDGDVLPRFGQHCYTQQHNEFAPLPVRHDRYLDGRKTSSKRRQLLIRPFNTKVFEYAKLAFRNEWVDPQVWKGFHIAQDPMRFLVLQALSRLPHWFTRGCTPPFRNRTV